MLFGELEGDTLARRLVGILADLLRKWARTAEEDTDLNLILVGSGEIVSGPDGIFELLEDVVEIGPSIVSARGEGGQGVNSALGVVVEDDVLDHGLAKACGEVDVDSQEVLMQRSGFQGGEKRLEPLESFSVTTDPEKFDPLKLHLLLTLMTIPNILQDGCERRHANTTTDKNSNLMIKGIFGGSTKRAVNTKPRKTNEIDDIAIPLRRIASKALSESSREIANLPNVDGNVIFVRGRSDGKGMPLPVGHLRNVHEEVHSRTILERRLLELNLDGLSRVANNFRDVRWKTGAVFTINTLEQVEAIGNENILIRVIRFAFTSSKVMDKAPITMPQHKVREN